MAQIAKHFPVLADVMFIGDQLRARGPSLSSDVILVGNLPTWNPEMFSDELFRFFLCKMFLVGNEE
ncbi:hypothetical protein SLEP1_g17260 [Rubroshorea leprosula]|uniref:Uncharacterized protein n=1 Tax=Rubroshorea leprosula TaxID=152421 RepID=A0AAV5ITN7_9ROSI|nr:hypothetical protein SLEP1_g17260 [Rubroshorea leprosula]